MTLDEARDLADLVVTYDGLGRMRDAIVNGDELRVVAGRTFVRVEPTPAKAWLDLRLAETAEALAAKGVAI